MQGAAKKSLSAGGKLSAILDTKLSEATPYKFSLDQVRSVGVNTLKRAFEENGVLCITDAFTHEAFNEAQSLVKQAFMTDVFPQLSIPLSEVENRTIFDIAARKELWKTGIVGNKGFGYLFAQPEAKEDVFRKNIDGQNIAFQMGSAYKANLALIAHETSQLTLATLLSVTGNKFGMISQDSAKVHRETLTEPHIDKYGKEELELNRSQAMAIGPNEGSVRLCFARFSHCPDVQSAICDVIDDEKFYDGTGFLAFKEQDQLMDILMQSRVFHVGAPGELIIWKSGVIHVEMVYQPKSTPNLAYKKSVTNSTVERYIVGTHQPIGFNQSQLTKIGLMADQGFIFHAYNNLNKGNLAGKNSVHLKKTQWKPVRQVPQSEKDRQNSVDISDESIQHFLAQQHPRILHCMGINQKNVFSDEVAIQVFNSE